MRTHRTVFGIFVLCHTCMPTQRPGSQERKEGAPYFLSSPDHYRVQVGGTVLFKCAVENLGDSTLIWKKEGRMISAGNRIIRKDSRMKLKESSLEITEVNEEDAGEYICNVETFGEPLDQAHRL